MPPSAEKVHSANLALTDTPKFNRRSARILLPTISRFLTAPRQAYDEPMIVDNVIYVDGRRAEEPGSLQEIYEAVRQRCGVAWIGLYKATEEEFASVAGEFGLHPLAVDDPIKAPLRTKLERYGGTLFLVFEGRSLPR